MLNSNVTKTKLRLLLLQVPEKVGMLCIRPLRATISFANPYHTEAKEANTYDCPRSCNSPFLRKARRKEPLPDGEGGDTALQGVDGGKARSVPTTSLSYLTFLSASDTPLIASTHNSSFELWAPFDPQRPWPYVLLHSFPPTTEPKQVPCTSATFPLQPLASMDLQSPETFGRST